MRVDEIQGLERSLTRALDLLIARIRQHTFGAVYYRNGEIQTCKATAIECIVNAYRDWAYSDDHDTSAGYVMVDAITLSLAEKVNDAKSAFERCHYAIRQTVLNDKERGGTEAKASEVMRRVLTLAGHATMSLDKVDRAIPYLSMPVKSIRWFEATSQTTMRKPIRDVVKAVPVRKLGGGRPPSVSENTVSNVVPHYYYYHIATMPSMNDSNEKKATNPYKKTAIKGIYLRLRKPNRLALVVNRVNGVTDLSLKHASIEDVWPKAIRLYAQGRDVSIDGLLSLKPRHDQLSAFLEWEREKEG